MASRWGGRPSNGLRNTGSHYRRKSAPGGGGRSSSITSYLNGEVGILGDSRQSVYQARRMKLEKT